MCQDISEVYERLGRCLVAVSEGVCAPDGKLLIESQITEVDSHGNVQLSGSGALGDFIAGAVKEGLSDKYPGIRVRTDTLGYAQRSFVGTYSETDASEARAVGEAAVKYAMKGDIDGSIAINRLPGDEYIVEPTLAKLGDVAKVTKHMPDEYINEAGNGVTESFIQYAKPIVGELPPTGLLEQKSYKK